MAETDALAERISSELSLLDGDEAGDGGDGAGGGAGAPAAGDMLRIDKLRTVVKGLGHVALDDGAIDLVLSEVVAEGGGEAAAAAADAVHYPSLAAALTAGALQRS